MSYLQTFAFDRLKIDRSFVERLGDDQPSEVVVRALLDIARKLGMRVVAEGIETSQQVAVLRQFGCLIGQGYLFSRPVPAQDATRLMRLFAQKPPARSRAKASATA